MNSKTMTRRLGAVSVLVAALGAGCSHHLQKTSADGIPRSSPPLCFQYRGEARPTPGTMSDSNIWFMANNTCSSPIDCIIWDDVTEQENRVFLPAYATNSYLIASHQPTRRVSFKVECAKR